MIVFDGKVDEKCREYTYRQTLKFDVIVMIIAGLIVGLASLAIYLATKFDYMLIACWVACVEIVVAPFVLMLDKKRTKKNLDQYENMQVSVKGFVLDIDEHITLTDVPGDGGVKHRYDAKNSAKITLIMMNEKKMTVLDEGDHVRISGTVKISDIEIYLDNCDYEMIQSVYE